MRTSPWLLLLLPLAACTKKDGAPPADTRLKTIRSTLTSSPGSATLTELTYDAADPSRLASYLVRNAQGQLTSTTSFRYPAGQSCILATSVDYTPGGSTNVDSICFDASHRVLGCYTRRIDGNGDLYSQDQTYAYNGSAQLLQTAYEGRFKTAVITGWKKWTWTGGNATQATESPVTVPGPPGTVASYTYDLTKDAQAAEESRRAELLRFGGGAHAWRNKNLMTSISETYGYKIDYLYTFDAQGRISELKTRDAQYGITQTFQFTYF